MTEDEARNWCSSRYDVTAARRLDAFASLLASENERQNLIAHSTLATIWNRHIVDSAQLVDLVPATGEWIDIGSGGGLPGLVVAILRNDRTTLIEPRRKRADFLTYAARVLNLANTRVIAKHARSVSQGPATIISARAVASIDVLFAETTGLGDLRTHFVLPRGRSAANDLAVARERWHGVFHVKPSVTDPDAGIVIASGVRRR